MSRLPFIFEIWEVFSSGIMDCFTGLYILGLNYSRRGDTSSGSSESGVDTVILLSSFSSIMTSGLISFFIAKISADYELFRGFVFP